MGNDRSELHKKVEARRKELQKVLADSEHAGHPALRIEALRTELSVVENATTGGWDSMAEVTAVELTNWLVATQNLLVDTKAMPPSATQREKPAQQLDASGGAAGGKSASGPSATTQQNKPASNAGTGNSGPDISDEVRNNETATGNSGNSASELGVSPPVHGKDGNQKV